MPDSDTLRLYGNEFETESIEPRSSGSARTDITHENGRRWRVDVTANGGLDAIVTTWLNGILATPGEPGWLNGALARLTRVV